MTDQHGNEWHINDTRGYIDAGPSCDECGSCECATCELPSCNETTCGEGSFATAEVHSVEHEQECIGLSVAYVCLDGGESLCEACFEKSGVVLQEKE